MRKIFMAVIAAVSMLVVGLVGTQSAQAYPIPPDANGYKFWDNNICIEPGNGIPDDYTQQTYYRVAYIAQQWNLRVNNTSLLALDYSENCAADGYPPSRRMVIGLYHGGTSTNECGVLVNGQYSVLNGFRRWTNGPGIYINQDNAGCVGNQTYRDHVISAEMGWLLGLTFLNSTGYNSRVMNFNSYSWNNVPLPDQNSGNTLAAIYAWAYCQPFGTAC